MMPNGAILNIYRTYLPLTNVLLNLLTFKYPDPYSGYGSGSRRLLSFIEDGSNANTDPKHCQKLVPNCNKLNCFREIAKGHGEAALAQLKAAAGILGKLSTRSCQHTILGEL